MNTSDPIEFRPFLRKAPVEIYFGGSLPHWRQEGATYFVTFRTADSLPFTVLDELRKERSEWLAAEGIDGSLANWREQLREQSEELLEKYSRRFSARWDDRLDRGSGTGPLRDPKVANIVRDALRFFHGTRLRLGDFVVMPNHVHALITPLGDWRLEDLLGSIKGTSARRINQRLAIGGAFWQRDSYDHIVRTAESLRGFQDYIRDNPMKAGIDPATVVSGTANYTF